MAKFKVTYIFNSADAQAAQNRAWNNNEFRGCRMQVSKVRGPLGKRKKWNIYRNGELYHRAKTSKVNAIKIAKRCMANCKAHNVNFFVFTVVED